MDRKYQIFISSTKEDLIEERKKVQETILAMYHFPIGMEMFSADDRTQWEIIKETIDMSDYYVLIIGHRYGTVIEEGEYAGISYTQKEFRYALEQKIPVLAFLIDDNVPIALNKIEQDSVKKEKLEEFKKEVKNGRIVQWWKSADDLANQVMNSLNKQFLHSNRPGWVRGEVKSKFDKEFEYGILRQTYKNPIGSVQRSEFSKRLDKLIRIINEAREGYEEPITLGYLSQYLGYESENMLKKFYLSSEEPNIKFMEDVAEQIGVNKLWFAKNADVPIFDVASCETNLQNILLDIKAAENVYIAMAKEGYGNCITFMLKNNDIKYTYYKHSFVFHANGGHSGLNQLMDLYEFLRQTRSIRNNKGNMISLDGAYMLSESEWVDLKKGNIYPAAIRKKGREYKPYILQDFLDIRYYYRSKDEYLNFYGEEFIKSQEYILHRLNSYI